MGGNAAWRAWAAPASNSAAPPRSHDRRVSPHEGQCRKASVASGGIAGPPCRRSTTPDRAAGPAGVSASAGQAEAPTSTSGPSPRNRCSYCCPPGNRLAKRKSIRPDELVNLPFIGFPSHYAPALKRVTDDYFAHAGVALLPDKPHTVRHAGDCFDAGASNRRGNAILISVA